MRLRNSIIVINNCVKLQLFKVAVLFVYGQNKQIQKEKFYAILRV